MIQRILRYFGKTAKTVRDKVDDSLDFIDDTLEKEHITSTIDKAKGATGKLVQKAGETVERGKMMAEDLLENEQIAKLKQQGEDLLQSGKASLDKALDSPVAKATADKAKELSSDLVDGAEKLSDRVDDYIGKKLGLDEEE